MKSNIRNRLIYKNIYLDKSIFSLISKAIIAGIFIDIYAFIEIFINGFRYRNILLITGAILSIITMIIYGMLTSSIKDNGKNNLLNILISFCGFFPYVFGSYLIFYECFWEIKLLFREYSYQTAIIGLFFLVSGFTIIRGMYKVKRDRTHIKENSFSLNWCFALVLVMFAFPRLIGGMSSLGNSFRLEIPFVLFWYWHFCTTLKKNSLLPYIAAIPILLFYILFDLYYIAFGKIFKIIDIKEIPELIKILPLSYATMGVMFIVIPAVVYLSFIDYKKYKQILTEIIIMFCLVFIAKYTPGQFVKIFNFAAKGVTEWSDKKSVEDNGRFMMILYSEAKRNLAIKQTAIFRNRELYKKEIKKISDYLNAKSVKKNIHLIVMESFLDPTLLKNIKFSKEPVSQEFSYFFKAKEGFSISPVFAGKTAQAEFEILCGIPALDSLDSIEFNLFTGSDAYGLPGILREIGYRTIASNSFRPDLFNAIPAYKSIGFNEIYFPAEYTPKLDTYLSTGDVTGEDIMFDGWLFDQNIKFISRIIKNTPEKPIFNYLIGSYGHYPFKINEDKHPEIIKMISANGGEELQRQVNQFYYRTGAVIKYVKELIKIDPDSMIIIVSDHLPFFVNNTDYKSLKYLDNIENANKYNRIYIVENGKPVKYKVIFHHDIPNLILNYITEGKYLSDNNYDFGFRAIDKTKYYEKYMKFMAHAIK